MEPSTQPVKRCYQFNGEAFRFNRSLGFMKIETRAVSQAKAKANICYQINQKMGFVSRANISLFGKLKEVMPDGTEKVIRLT